ncbi:MAG TPA: riboflavin biosynthesis protein RibF [Solirubrobacteraceae bacterium]|nr:riboflavin biosynthesis protein RibF [Solirubrobacteraceae bacterium]
MKLIHLPDARPASRRIAIGTFDGVHLGHRAVIGDSDTVLTFEPHPATIVAPARLPRLLTPLPVKAELISELGVGELIVIDFDGAFAARTASSFIDEILVGQLGVSHVAVGENFRFGHRALGDAELLASDLRFETRVESLLEVGDEVVSSSHIRALILAGDVADAAAFLGRPFELRGEVVAGDRRGRELGFPTANLVPDPALVSPGHGVYACLADGRPAAVSIGVRPTFETGRGELIEAYVLDFSGDLYGQTLRLTFLERLRGERRFESVEALVDQIQVDVARTREICLGVIAPPGLLP